MTTILKSDKLESLTSQLEEDFGELPTRELLDKMINDVFEDKIALVSSFGTEAALLLSLVADVNKDTPVVFLDTEKHFPETLEYRDRLIKLLGLTNVRSVKPEPSGLKAVDPDGTLWKTDKDKCCYMRKVLPLEEALAGFDAWINGRKRVHGGDRSALPTLEHDGRRIKVNALANWSQEDIDAEWKKRNLPEHPLVQFNFLSVGCNTAHCTQQSDPNDPSKRSGRWAGLGKTECGIHNRPDDFDGPSGGI